MPTMIRTPLEGHSHATVDENGGVSSDFGHGFTPQPGEPFAFYARGVALRLHPQNEGLAIHVGLHTRTWEEWQALAEQAIRLASHNGVKVSTYPSNSGQVTVGDEGRRRATFYAPHNAVLPESLIRLAWRLADVIPAERILG